MIYELDKKITYDGNVFYGREVTTVGGEFSPETVVMFQEELFDSLWDYDKDEFRGKEEEEIDSSVFCYVPALVLRHDDEYVSKWCIENSIDI